MWKCRLQIERTPKALDQPHRAGARALATEARLADQMRGDDSVDDGEHRAHDVGAAGEDKAQGIGNAQHPLAHRLLGKHFVDEQRRALRHAPRPATGAEPALMRCTA